MWAKRYEPAASLSMQWTQWRSLENAMEAALHQKISAVATDCRRSAVQPDLVDKRHGALRAGSPVRRVSSNSTWVLYWTTPGDCSELFRHPGGGLRFGLLVQRKQLGRRFCKLRCRNPAPREHLLRGANRRHRATLGLIEREMGDHFRKLYGCHAVIDARRQGGDPTNRPFVQNQSVEKRGLTSL